MSKIWTSVNRTQVCSAIGGVQIPNVRFSDVDSPHHLSQIYCTAFIILTTVQLRFLHRSIFKFSFQFCPSLEFHEANYRHGDQRVNLFSLLTQICLGSSRKAWIKLKPAQMWARSISWRKIVTKNPDKDDLYYLLWVDIRQFKEWRNNRPSFWIYQDLCVFFRFFL